MVKSTSGSQGLRLGSTEEILRSILSGVLAVLLVQYFNIARIKGDIHTDDHCGCQYSELEYHIYIIKKIQSLSKYH